MTTDASSPCSPTFDPRRVDPLSRAYADTASEAWQCRAYVPMRALRRGSSGVWSPAGGGKESVSLYAKRAFPYGMYGWRRPGRTVPSTAVPGVLLTRKRSQVQTLSRPPGTTFL
jgi:hypothetical protein